MPTITSLTTTAEIAALTTTQIAALTTEDWTIISAEQIAALTPTQVAQISATGFAVIDASTLAAMSATQFAAFTTKQIGALTATQAAGMDTADVAAITSTAIVVGNQKVMRDPSIAQGPDGTFHLVWTSSWRGDYGFGYASSKDLIHWSKQKYIDVMAYDTSTVNVWAPELFYDDESEHFIIVWASTIPYKFARGIEDERNNHRLYYTTTKDFNKFSDTKLFLDPGYSVIDAVIVKRGKGDYVLVLKDNTRPMRNIKVAFGSSTLGPFTNISGAFTPNFCEGPSVVKVGNDWLVYFDAYRDKYYGAVKTADFKTFEDISKEVSVPEGHKHGTIFMVDEKVLKNILSKFKK